jgi:hypothetical protein
MAAIVGFAHASGEWLSALYLIASHHRLGHLGGHRLPPLDRIARRFPAPVNAV